METANQVDMALVEMVKGFETGDEVERHTYQEYRRRISHFVFTLLAEFCAEFRLPFDLMIGVNRSVYRDGVYQGQDLYDSRVSLTQYQELFNRFPQVTFPVSVLASVTNQELVSHAWIFPNVVASGHWWYSHTPLFIERDLSVRLEAVPQTKLIGYYSDIYKLEFAIPKWAMYKRVLAKTLAEQFVVERGWSEERAVELGKLVLRGNVERVFGMP
jgi:glucuronate isomerase